MREVLLPQTGALAQETAEGTEVPIGQGIPYIVVFPDLYQYSGDVSIEVQRRSLTARAPSITVIPAQGAATARTRSPVRLFFRHARPPHSDDHSAAHFAP